MNTFKSSLYFVIGLLLIAPLWESCGRGDQDPAITFRGRDGRITGKWTLSTVQYNSFDKEEQSTSSGTNTEWDSYETMIENGTRNYTRKSYTNDYNGNESESVNKTVSDYAVTVTIKKDNTYEYKLERTVNKSCSDNSSSCNPVSLDDPQTTTEQGSGEWYWEDSKNGKIGIDLDPGVKWFGGNLLQLKNSEIIFMERDSSSEEYSSAGYTSTELDTSRTKATWTAAE